VSASHNGLYRYSPADSYRLKHKLAGIIFLHEISQARLTSLEVFDMLKAFCGCEAARNVTFVTTKWDDNQEAIGEQREQQLREQLNELLSHGMHLARFWPARSSSSAWNAFNPILKQGPVDSIQIQRELVDLRKRLSQTGAGISLGSHVKYDWSVMLDLFGRLLNVKQPA
jgi:hypothetical protein